MLIVFSILKLQTLHQSIQDEEFNRAFNKSDSTRTSIPEGVHPVHVLREKTVVLNKTIKATL